MGVMRSAVAAQALTIAQGFVGENRTEDAGEIARMLAVEGLPFAEGGSDVPYCAAFVSYCALKAYCQLAGIAFTADDAVSVFRGQEAALEQLWFKPSASCGVIMDAARAAGRWMSNEESDASDIQPGWLALFNWSGGTAPEHVGFVLSADTVLQTIEGNTSEPGVAASQIDGGYIARRVRSYNLVVGFVTA